MKGLKGNERVKACLVFVLRCLALPNAPTSLLVNAVTANSISLSWNAAQTDLTDPVMSYIVQYRPKTLTVQPPTNQQLHHDGFQEIRDVTDTEYDVSGLEAFSEYELRVMAVNSVGRSAASRSVDATTSQLGTSIVI